MSFPLIDTDILRKKSAFSVTWNIDNFVVCPKKFGEPLYSPEFTVGCLGATRWRIILYPRGSENSDYISCYLERLTDSSKLEEVFVKFQFGIFDLDDNDFLTIAAISFRKNQIWGFSNYKKRDIFDKILHSQFLHKLTLKCKMSLSDVHVSLTDKKLDMYIFSSDFKYLYESGHSHDIVFKCNGQDFKAHRAIICARAPKFAAEIHVDFMPRGIWEREVNNITPDALNCLLLYLYSGRLVLPLDHCLAELFIVSRKYDLPELRKRLISYPRHCTCRTSMNVEYKSVSWQIHKSKFHSFETLTKIIPVECENVNNLIMRCYFVSKARAMRNEHIDVSFVFCDFDKDQPISIWVDINMLDNRGYLLDYCSEYIFFETNDECKIPFNISTEGDVEEFIISCNLTICYGERYTYIVSSDETTELTNSILIDYEALSLDFKKLLTSVTFADASLIVENVSFPAHRAILAARSSVFKQMFECDMIEKLSGIVCIKDLSAETVNSLLSYIYTGHIDPLRTDFLSLYSAADKYAIQPLVKSCSAYLMKALNIENSCHILILAYQHCDDELQIRAIRFIQLNFHEIKNTINWLMLTRLFKYLAKEVLAGLVSKRMRLVGF